MSQYILQANIGFHNLKIVESPIPEVSGNDVLVKFHAASLNYRDIMIANGTYLWPTKPNVVPGSDGAGEVLAIGPNVTRFQPGQRVLTTHFQTLIGGTITLSDSLSALGGPTDGVFRTHGIFNEQGLVHIPSSLSYREASTLPCAALTAWNALYGARPLKPGDTVLVQGTGGVSLFAVQFALVGGAEVIVITSDEGKEKMLKEMGVKHVINYKEILEWGQVAKDMSLGGRGADYIIEIGGPKTMVQSSVVAAIDGTICIVGTRAGEGGGNAPAHTDMATFRRIMVGSRLQLEDLIKAIVVNGIKPVVDKKIFGYGKLEEAYRYLDEQKHVGKVVIDII